MRQVGGLSVRVSGKARQDLLGIFRYLSEHSPDAADRFLRDFDRRLTQLTRFPFIGRERTELRVALRSLVLGDHLILYEVDAEHVVVYRVLHGRMDIGKEILR